MLDQCTLPSCPICGTPLDRKGKKFCSWACYQQHHQVKLKLCLQCGASFHPLPGGPTIYCSRPCADLDRLTRPERPCGGCGEFFQPKTDASKFCTRGCSAKNQSRLRRQQRLCLTCNGIVERSRGQSVFCSDPCGRKTKGGLPELPCATCAKVFTLARWKATDGKPHYCSTACYRTARRGRPIVIRVARRGHPGNDTVAGLPWDAIGREYELGESAAVLAQRYDVSAHTIIRRLRNQGLTIRASGFGRWCIANDGHKVQSGWELLVDNWLSKHDVPHECQPRLPFATTRRADFYAKGYYIEMWGVVHNRTYSNRRRDKIEQYAAHGLKLLQLYPGSVERDDCEPLWVLLPHQQISMSI